MLDEFLLEVGYDDEQFGLIKNSYPLSKYNESTLLYNIRRLYTFFIKNGVSNEGFINITLTTPNVICISIENIKNRISDLNTLGFNKIDCFKLIEEYPYILELSFQKLNTRAQCLLDLGFSKNSVVSIFLYSPELVGLECAFFRKRFDFFLKFGFKKDETIKVIEKYPKLLNCSIDFIKNKIDEFISMKFSKRDIVKITTILPEMFFSDEEMFDKKFKNFLEFGFTDLDIVQIIKKVPYILDEYYMNDIQKKLELLLDLGFSKEDIIFMICNNPYLIINSRELFVNNFREIKNFGFNDKELLIMIRNNPLLLSYETSSVIEKIEYYKKIEAIDIVKLHSKFLSISLKLVKARYYYLDNRRLLSNETFCDIFLTEAKFFKLYKIDNQTLLGGNY